MNPRNAIVSILPALVFPLSLHAADSSWKQEWEKTVQAANKEGQVTAYVYRYEAAFNAFRAEYPGIKLNTVSGTGSQLGTRLMAERRGGKNLADLFSSRANTNYNVLYRSEEHTSELQSLD